MRRSLLSGYVSCNKYVSVGTTYAHILPCYYRNKVVESHLVRANTTYIGINKLLINDDDTNHCVWSMSSKNPKQGWHYHQDVQSYYYNYKSISDELFIKASDTLVRDCLNKLYPNCKIIYILETDDEIGKLYKAEIELPQQLKDNEVSVRQEDYKLYLYALDSPTRNFCNE
jgi:hypothetical protein